MDIFEKLAWTVGTLIVFAFLIALYTWAGVAAGTVCFVAGLLTGGALFFILPEIWLD